MAAWEGKRYELSDFDADNWEKYMVELGVGYFTRWAGQTVKPTISLSRKGDIYTLTTESTFKNTVINFKLGEEFDEETIDGRNVKSVCTLPSPNKLVQKQGGDKPSTITREFTPDECITTMELGNIRVVRKYKAV